MIQTKVARIIDSTQIVLAAGENDGVTKGMEFVIYDLSDQIFDPETKEDLGRIELVKGKVIAEHVQEKITIARTPSRIIDRIFDPLASVGDFFTKRTVKETVQDQLKVEGATAIQKDQVVRVGDSVRSLETASVARFVTSS